MVEEGEKGVISGPAGEREWASYLSATGRLHPGVERGWPLGRTCARGRGVTTRRLTPAISRCAHTVLRRPIRDYGLRACGATLHVERIAIAGSL